MPQRPGQRTGRGSRAENRRRFLRRSGPVAHFFGEAFGAASPQPLLIFGGGCLPGGNQRKGKRRKAEVENGEAGSSEPTAERVARPQCARRRRAHGRRARPHEDAAGDGGRDQARKR